MNCRLSVQGMRWHILAVVFIGLISAVGCSDSQSSDSSSASGDVDVKQAPGDVDAERDGEDIPDLRSEVTQSDVVDTGHGDADKPDANLVDSGRQPDSDTVQQPDANGEESKESLYVGIIDGGVDPDHPAIEPYLGHSNETFNGIDDDCNGYVDDVYGIDARKAEKGETQPIVSCEGLGEDRNASPNPNAEPKFEFEKSEDGTKVVTGIKPWNHGNGMNYVVSHLVDELEERVERPIKIINCQASQSFGQLEKPPNILDKPVSLFKANGAILRKDYLQCLDYFADLERRGLNMAVVNHSGGFPVDLEGALRPMLGISGAVLPETTKQKAKKYWLHTYTETDDNGNEVVHDEVEQAIRQLGQQGITFVAAAGNFLNNNDSGDNKFYPASADLPNQITVASVDSDNHYWFESDQALPGPGNSWVGTGYGETTVELAAPGRPTPRASISGLGTHELENGEVEKVEDSTYTREDLKADLGIPASESLEQRDIELGSDGKLQVPRGDYIEYPEGHYPTSPAAAYVSAAVALLKAKDPSLSTQQVRQRLIETGHDVEQAPTDYGQSTDIHIRTQSDKFVDPEPALDL